MFRTRYRFSTADLKHWFYFNSINFYYIFLFPIYILIKLYKIFFTDKIWHAIIFNSSFLRCCFMNKMHLVSTYLLRQFETIIIVYFYIWFCFYLRRSNLCSLCWPKGFHTLREWIENQNSVSQLRTYRWQGVSRW